MKQFHVEYSYRQRTSEDMSNLYILTNASMPGLVKIGYSKNVSQRVKELFNTSQPTEFEIYHTFQCQDPKQLERKVHRALEKYRVHGRREFFKIEPQVAVLVVQAELENQRRNIILDNLYYKVLNLARKFTNLKHIDSRLRKYPYLYLTACTSFLASTLLVIFSSSISLDMFSKKYDFGKGLVPSHQHSNGGGWVANTAKVDDKVKVSIGARVFDNAVVDGESVVSEGAQIFGNAVVVRSEVGGSSRVYGDAYVGASKVNGSSKIFGQARLDGPLYQTNTHTFIEVSDNVEIDGQPVVNCTVERIDQPKDENNEKKNQANIPEAKKEEPIYLWVCPNLSGDISISGNVKIHGKVDIRGIAKISDNVKLDGMLSRISLDGRIFLSENVTIDPFYDSNFYMEGTIELKGSQRIRTEWKSKKNAKNPRSGEIL